jgi:tetratricopeptide (TPR) repeat protein
MQVARKLNEYGSQLGASNLKESQLRVATEVLAFCKVSKLDSDFTMMAMGNLSITLSNMSRYQEAEIFARELVAESEKLTALGAAQLMAVGTLSIVLVNQDKFEEARHMAHAGLERFRPIAPVGEAMVRLMEAEALALSSLGRHEEALVLSQHCLTARLDNPRRFQYGGQVPAGSFSSLAKSMIEVGRLDEAETMLNKALAVLKRDGIEIHADMVSAMGLLAKVYLGQGRKKESTAMVKAVRKLVPRVFPKDHPNYKKIMG